MSKELKNPFTGLLFSIAWLAGGIWFCWDHFGNSFEELALIRNAETTNGVVVETWEEPLDTERGSTKWLHGALYRFHLLDGREITGKTKARSGRLKSEYRDLQQFVSVEVEYVRGNPAINRIKGDGNSTVFQWFWRETLSAIIFLACVVIPACVIAAQAINEWRVKRLSPEGGIV